MESINHRFYKKSFDSHGISPKGVHWENKHTQYKRFEVLLSYIKDIENSYIVDIGCGFGDMVKYIKEKKLKPKRYLGIDCEDFMIDISQKRFNENFLKYNFLKEKLPIADYLICSGAFNLLEKDEFFYAIKNCFESSQKGFIFNYLTKHSIYKINQKELIKFIDSLKCKYHTKDNYLRNDATIFLEK